MLQDHEDIGKIVISHDPQPDLSVPVPRPNGPLVVAKANIEKTRVQPRSAKSLMKPHHTYLLVGGLKGICGTLAIHLASQGAKHIAAMSRSGYQDDASQRVIANIKALGCSIDLLCGDVTSLEHVRNCYRQIANPVGGIVQGAAVFRV